LGTLTYFAPISLTYFAYFAYFPYSP